MATKYEYRFLLVSGDYGNGMPKDVAIGLNAAGEEGFDLVHTDVHKESDRLQYRCILRRTIEE